MCNDITWPTFDTCSAGNQKHVDHNEPWYSILCDARANRFLRFRVFAVVFALSLSTLLGVAGPVIAADANTTVPRAKMKAAKQTIKALQMELAEARKDRAALQEQLEMASGEIAKQIEKVFTSKSWKSDPEVMVLRGKLEAAGKDVEKYAAATRDATAEVAALKIKLKAAGSQIDTLGKEKVGALSEVSRLKDDLAAALSRTKRLEAERGKLAKSEQARKAVVQKLAIALTANKTQDKELLGAKNTAKKFRDELQAADKDIADLETRLAKANAQRAKAEKMHNALQQSEQLVESLKTKLDKSGNERIVLKAQLDETQNEIAQRIEKVFAAASQETKASKQRIEQLGARIESVENEKSELKQKYARAQQQAAELEKAVKESRSESERLNKQVQAALAKADSASKERAQVEQAAAKEAEALRDQLTTAKQQISDAQAEANTARNELAKRIEKLISVAAAQTSTDVSGLKNKLAIANDEIARLKAAHVKNSISSATQQSAQPK